MKVTAHRSDITIRMSIGEYSNLFAIAKWMVESPSSKLGAFKRLRPGEQDLLTALATTPYEWEDREKNDSR